MKKRVNIIWLFAVLFLPYLSYSQSNNIVFDVSLIEMDQTYTKSQIITIFGEPSVYFHQESEFGLDERYHYDNNMFIFHKGFINYFSLRDQKFSIFNSYIPGGIKVGDPITQFNQLSFGKLHFKGKAGEFYFQIGDADDVIEITANEDNFITRILYIIHV